MLKSKKVKAILFTAGLTLGLSALITANAFAYTSAIATYTTVSGDSLFKISKVFNTTVDNLVETNQLKSTTLDVGQTLKVPGGVYTVKKGDTLFLISQKYDITLASLSRANNIYNDKLDIGQTLAVPMSAPEGPAYNPEKANAPAPAPAVTSAAAPAAPTTVAAPAKTQSTAATLSAPVTKQTETAVNPSGDLDLLARLIMAEAQGEPYQAKVAIGAVVMNRVQSGLFAGSINDVIYQRINGYYQFTPVVNGWINKPANTDSINAAKDALNGVDPTNGALWYYDDTTTNQFMLAKKVAVKIGHMVFAY